MINGLSPICYASGFNALLACAVVITFALEEFGPANCAFHLAEDRRDVSLAHTYREQKDRRQFAYALLIVWVFVLFMERFTLRDIRKWSQKMMDKNFHRKRACFICGIVEFATIRGFSDSGFYCGRHQNDEIEFHQALPERSRISKDDKAQERLFAKRWKGIPVHLIGCKP